MSAHPVAQHIVGVLLRGFRQTWVLGDRSARLAKLVDAVVQHPGSSARAAKPPNAPEAVMKAVQIAKTATISAFRVMAPRARMLVYLF